MEYCICGHDKISHNINGDEIDPDPDLFNYCGLCRFYGILRASHRFKLDNLSYIEQLAKERKLV